MFYVYELVDPRNGAPFYVGKGKGGRMLAHEREAISGSNHPKCRRIREVWASGLTIERRIVSRHDIEAEAYAAEGARIREIGLANLCNLVAGGEGGNASTSSKECRALAIQNLKAAAHYAAFHGFKDAPDGTPVDLVDGCGRVTLLSVGEIRELCAGLVQSAVEAAGREFCAGWLLKQGGVNA